MKIIVDRDINKDEMQIAIQLPMALLNFDKEARDRLDYLMLRVATAPMDSATDKLIEALVHVLVTFKQKAELQKAELQKLYGHQLMQQSAQSGALSAQGLQNMLGAYGSGGVVAPNIPPSNPPPAPDAFKRMMRLLKDKT